MLNVDKVMKKFANYCGFKVEGERRCDPMEELNKHLENSTLSATPLADLLPYDYYESGEIVAKLPVHGEWKGVPTSGALMIGQRGQLFKIIILQ